MRALFKCETGILQNSRSVFKRTDSCVRLTRMITKSELVWVVLLEGAIGGAILCLLAFLLSRFVRDIVGRTLLATVLFAAAGAYYGFAVMAEVRPIWLLIELLQCIAFGALGLAGWRESSNGWQTAKWLALGWALHPIWDFGLHYIGPGTFAPWTYTILCISFDWVVAAYIFIAYRMYRGFSVAA
jgi:hypothetical protein